MSQFSASVIFEGRSISSQTPVRLHAGPLTMLLEPASGFLRQIRLGDQMVLNGIYGAVRDRNWGTVEPVLRELKIDQQPDSFAVTFMADCRMDDIVFVWKGAITGDREGMLRYTFDGEAKSDFLRNRIGFCVLHGSDCAGRPCVVEHADGRRTEAEFPRFISPQQPFKQMRAITHTLTKVGEGSLAPAANVRVEVRMDGDAFEMEDQRNWTDASFKTYCTPLELPFPAQVKAGEKIQQEVVVRLSGVRTIANPSDREPNHRKETLLPSPRQTGDSGSAGASPYQVTGAVGVFHPLPKLGLGMASHDLPLNRDEVGLLRALKLDHLRCDLTPLAEGWEARWVEAVRQAQDLGVRLQAALYLGPHVEDQLKAIALAARTTSLVDAWLIFMAGEKATVSKWTELARQHLAGAGGLIVGGTDAYFAELNRHRPLPGSTDAITWSINPQVHAFDNLSLVETLEAQWTTVLSARQIFAGELMISPVTLLPRFNPSAIAEPPLVPPDVLPPQVDVRQMSLFGAAWTLGSIASLSRESSLRSITFYETTGWRGVMEWAERPRLPHKFVTRPGWVFPMYFVFALLADFDECQTVPVSNPLEQAALFVRHRSQPGQVRLLLANLTLNELEITLPPGLLAERRLTLDSTNAVAAMREPETFIDHGWSLAPGIRRIRLSPLGLSAVDGRTD